MKKVLTILAFFLLLECQVFIGQDNYSLFVAVGLLALIAYDIVFEKKYFFFREQKLSQYGGTQLTAGEKIGATVYAVIIGLSLILGSSWGSEFAFVLLAGILSVTLISLLDLNKKKRFSDTTWISSFTIPKLFLYFINYLLSVQIHQSIAYQSILLLSCFVLYDLVDFADKISEKARTGKINEKEFKHYLFHRWSKYWNFFLGVWFFITLRANGLIGARSEYVLLAGFMVIFFVYLLKNESKFSVKDFLGIVFFAALLAALSPISQILSGNELPTYILATIIFIAFDVGDTYFHQREFKEANGELWSHKAVLYVLIAIYITQLHFMLGSPIFNFDQVAASVFGTKF